jgi:hypothetical protein
MTEERLRTVSEDSRHLVAVRRETVMADGEYAAV